MTSTLKNNNQNSTLKQEFYIDDPGFLLSGHS